MTTPVNIANPPAQPAATGGAGTGASGKPTDNDFGSLFATLLGLTGANGPDAKAAGPNGPAPGNPRTGFPAIDDALAAADALLPGDANKTAAPQSPQDLLANLLHVLGQLARQLETNQTANPDLIKQVSSAIAALDALVNPGAAKLAANGQPDAVLAAASNATGNTGAMGDAASSPMSATQKELSREMTALVRELAAKSPDAAQKLAGLADKLDGALPDLASKLHGLAQKFADSASNANPKTGASGAATSTSGGSGADLTLLGSANARQGATPPQNINVDNGARILLDANSATEAGKAAAQAKQQQKTTHAQAAAANNARPQNTAVAAVAPPSTQQASDSTASGSHTDTLLAAQSAAQSSVRTDTAAAVRPMTAAYQPPAPNINIPAIAFQLVTQARDGASRFTIRLDPPEMGKIDVKMRMDGSGNLHAHLQAERADTLGLLQRDARGLERALVQAGIDNGQTNLQFSLKQNPFARQDQGGGHHQYAPAFETGHDDDMPTVSAPVAISYRGMASPGGINVLA